MAEKFEGYIAKLLKKEGTKKNGQRWFKHTFILTDGQTESPWIGTDFNAPFPAVEGDYLKLEANSEAGKDGNTYFTVVKGTATVVKNPPPRKGATTAAGTELPAATGTARDTIITFMNSRTAALEAIRIALENKSLPLTKTESKAGEATRFEQIMLAIDKATVRYFHDATTLRLLDQVADEGEVADGSETPDAGDDTIDETTGEIADGDDDVSF